MNETVEMTMQQKKIADIIMAYYLPGTVENHDDIIEIDNFVDLFAPVSNYNLFEIEKVMEILGFKDEQARVDLSFFVNIPEKHQHLH